MSAKMLSFILPLAIIPLVFASLININRAFGIRTHTHNVCHRVFVLYIFIVSLLHFICLHANADDIHSPHAIEGELVANEMTTVKRSPSSHQVCVVRVCPYILWTWPWNEIPAVSTLPSLLFPPSFRDDARKHIQVCRWAQVFQLPKFTAKRHNWQYMYWAWTQIRAGTKQQYTLSMRSRLAFWAIYRFVKCAYPADPWHFYFHTSFNCAQRERESPFSFESERKEKSLEIVHTKR